MSEWVVILFLTIAILHEDPIPAFLKYFLEGSTQLSNRESQRTEQVRVTFLFILLFLSPLPLSSFSLFPTIYHSFSIPSSWHFSSVVAGGGLRSDKQLFTHSVLSFHQAANHCGLTSTEWTWTLASLRLSSPVSLPWRQNRRLRVQANSSLTPHVFKLQM